MQTHPLLAKVVVSRLDLDTLPDPLRVPGVRGTVRVEGSVRGSLSDPIASRSICVAATCASRPVIAAKPSTCAVPPNTPRPRAPSTSAPRCSCPARSISGQQPCTGKRIANVRLNGEAPFDFEKGIPQLERHGAGAARGLAAAGHPGGGRRARDRLRHRSLQLDRTSSQPTALVRLQLADVRVDRPAVGDGSIELKSQGERARATFEIQRAEARATGSVNAGVTWASGC